MLRAMRPATLFVLSFASACFGHDWGDDYPYRPSSNQGTASSNASEAAQLAGALWEVGTAPLSAGPYFPESSSLAADLRSDLPAQVAHALRAVGRDTRLCQSGSATTVAAANATANCSNIGNNGVYPAGGTITFTNCVLSNGATLDGTVVTTNSEALATNATCSATATVTSSFTSATNLTFTTAAKEVITYTNLNGTATVTRALGSAPSSYQMAIASGERKDVDASGNLTGDQTVSGSVQVTLTTSARTESGSLTVRDVVSGDAQSLTETAVVRDTSCCNPVSGNVTWTDFEVPDGDADEDAGASTIHSLVFGPLCGESTYDGNSVTINACANQR